MTLFHFFFLKLTFSKNFPQRYFKFFFTLVITKKANNDIYRTVAICSADLPFRRSVHSYNERLLNHLSPEYIHHRANRLLSKTINVPFIEYRSLAITKKANNDMYWTVTICSADLPFRRSIHSYNKRLLNHLSPEYIHHHANRLLSRTINIPFIEYRSLVVTKKANNTVYRTVAICSADLPIRTFVQRTFIESFIAWIYPSPCK